MQPVPQGLRITAIMAILAACIVFVPAQSPVPSAQTAAACAQCHAGIARTFRATGMGRSFARMSPQNAIENFGSNARFYHNLSDTYFEMTQRGGKYYQRRWQIGFDSKETNLEEKQVDFVLGSGNHARTYLHLTPRNTLEQLPLGWYAEKGGNWGMNPGYDRADHPGSTRVIHYECMFCHNAYPRIPQGHQETGAEARYLQPLPEGIDCQRCHGPGQRHIDAASKGAKTEEIRAAIVNPARLSPEREIEVCLQCHLETSSRRLPHSLLRFGRGPFSYVPGQPLAEFRLSFDREPGKNEEFEIAHAGYRLLESDCFLQSAGKLRCTTCHNPHDVGRGEAAAIRYNAVCRNCHASRVQQTAGHPAGADCTGCHMPKRRTDDAVHVVMTDHMIVRRPPPGDLLAEKNEKHETPATSYRGEVVPYYPAKPEMSAENQLHIALAQVIDRSNLEAGLPRLANLIERHRPARAGFYSALGDAWRAAGDNANAIAAFEEAVRRDPASEIVRLQLGNALLESRQWVKAEAAFRRAKMLKPDDAAAWGLLGWVLWQQDKTIEAKSSLETAIKLNPDSPDLHNYFGLLSIGIRDVDAAERAFRRAVNIDPGVAEWRLNLAKLLAARGQIDEAAYHAKAAVRTGPDIPAVHELLGRLLAAKEDFRAAVPELQAAVRLKPDSWLAHYELGVALARLDRRAEAVEHLKRATQGTDAAAKAAAEQVLRQLGQ
jgi:predicted CXXCH cytochrome family protein